MKDLKNVIENMLLENGYSRKTDLRATGSHEYYANAEYINCYGTVSRSPFVINHPKFGPTRIECRSQEQSGTTDQKFPYLLECAKGMPEQNVIFILSGEGFKNEAISFLRRGAKAISSKKVSVQTPAQFEQWLSKAAQNGEVNSAIHAMWGSGKSRLSLKSIGMHRFNS